VRKDPAHIEWRGPPPGGRQLAQGLRGGGVPHLESRALFGGDLDRAALSRSSDVNINSTGKLTVDVNAPKGTRVAAEGEGFARLL